MEHYILPPGSLVRLVKVDRDGYCGRENPPKPSDVGLVVRVTGNYVMFYDSNGDTEDEGERPAGFRVSSYEDGPTADVCYTTKDDCYGRVFDLMLHEIEVVQVAAEKGYKKNMARTNEIIGYRIKAHSDGKFIHRTDHGHFFSQQEPEPISRPDAYRRLAGFLEENDGFDDVNDLEVVPVYRETTPVEDASAELGKLLSSLCNRHGLDLGLNQEQINKQIAGELEALKAGGTPSLGFLVGGIPKVR